jgi:DNA-binding transcriptional ArsR family regulator
MSYRQNQAIEALSALGDSTRRTIFEQVAARPQAVGELAARFPISRPAVSQHLRVLKAAGLVTDSAEGARRIYRLDPRGIGAMRTWLDAHWASALDAFAAFADADHQTSPQKEPSP